MRKRFRGISGIEALELSIGSKSLDIRKIAGVKFNDLLL